MTGDICNDDDWRLLINYLRPKGSTFAFVLRESLPPTGFEVDESRLIGLGRDAYGIIYPMLKLCGGIKGSIPQQEMN